MVKQPVDRSSSPSLKVDKLLNNADVDLIRFAHVIRRWGNDNPGASFYYEAIAESLSMIVLKGDSFTRSLTHIHAPKPGRVEIRNIYRAAFEHVDLSEVTPTVAFELHTGGNEFGPRVDLSDSLKCLREHLERLYADSSKIATPAFEVIKYLTTRGWFVYGYQCAEDGYTVDLTNSVHSVEVRINYGPMRLDRAAIRKYQQTRKH